MTDLRKLNVEELKALRNKHVKENIGEWNKPDSYFLLLNDIDDELFFRGENVPEDWDAF